MIGVIAKPGQEPLVEEFFELFKTPWEFHRPGSTYDVVVATTDAIPYSMPRLFVSYGAAPKDSDGGAAERIHRGGNVQQAGTAVPIYAGLLNFKADPPAAACLTADIGVVGITARIEDTTTIRVGFDLFEEVRVLLSAGQPVDYASIPTLDLHIAMLRRWILAAGLPLVEIVPCPAEHDFAVCLTHDIDFVGIRRHFLDHTMWGFLYRSTIGGIYNAVRSRLPIRRLLKMWRAAASLPFVYLGWLNDFWEPFAWYLTTEKDLPATYYLIPFKRRPGDRVSGRRAARRAVAYDISDVQDWAARLVAAGCEVGVHGIDAWHSVEKGRAEMARITAATGGTRLGIRMHWLLRDEDTTAVLDQAGYSYDSTVGYNETVGYHAGTSQVFRPAGARTLLELPMHVQDGALFYPNRLDLSEPEAERRCQCLVDHVRRSGGVLTVLWHDRSHGPERFWGEFYRDFVHTLRSSKAWFGTGSQVVSWFRARRAVCFDRVDANGGRVILRHHGDAIRPMLRVRVYRPSVERRDAGAAVDVPWNGATPLELDLGMTGVSDDPAPLAAAH